MIERGKLQNEEKAKQERVAKKEAEPSAEKKKHTPPAFPNKGRKKFVAPMAKLDGMSEFGGETPIKNPLQSTEDQQIVSSIYGNKDLSESREKQLRSMMFGGAPPQSTGLEKYVPAQAQEEEESEEEVDAG